MIKSCVLTNDSMNQLIENLSKGGMIPVEMSSRKDTLIPQYGYSSSDGKDIIRVEVPGLTAEDIKLEVKNRLLVISFSRQSLMSSVTPNNYKLELSFPSIYLLKNEHINAEVKNGLLTIEVNLAECDQSFIVPIIS